MAVDNIEQRTSAISLPQNPHWDDSIDSGLPLRQLRLMLDRYDNAGQLFAMHVERESRFIFFDGMRKSDAQSTVRNSLDLIFPEGKRRATVTGCPSEQTATSNKRFIDQGWLDLTRLLCST